MLKSRLQPTNNEKTPKDSDVLVVDPVEAASGSGSNEMLLGDPCCPETAAGCPML